MPKIAFYINSLGKGGAEHVVVNLAEHFKSKGYEVVLVTSRKLEEEYEISDDIERIYSELTEDGVIIKNRIVHFITRFKYIRGIWKKSNPDIVVSFIGKLNMMAVLTLVGLKTPLIMSVRSDPNREYKSKMMRIISKTIFVKADGLVLQTDEAMKYFPRYIQKKACILPNALNPSFIRERLDITRKDEIVTVGRLDANKNHQMLIRAFRNISSDYPQMKLIIYGEGYEGSDTRPILETMAKKYGIEDKVIFGGRQTEIADLICRSRIFVLSSNVEGMPNALLEAMSLGLAVISTDCPCGGPRAVIKEGQNGLLIPIGDTKALEIAMRRILENPMLEESLGKNANQIGEDLAPEKVNMMWQNYIESKMK